MENNVRAALGAVLLLVGPVFAGQDAHGLVVTDAGADPTGKTDSTGAIQACIDRLAAAGGGTVSVPPGEYRISFLTLRPHVNLRLAGGAGRATEGWTPEAAARAMDPSRSAIMRSVAERRGRWWLFLFNLVPPTAATNGFSDITVSGGVFDCEGRYLPGAFACGRNIRLENMVVKDLPNNHAFQIDGCTNVVVTNCLFAGYTFGGKRSSVMTRETIQVEQTSPGALSGNPANTPISCARGVSIPNSNVSVTGCWFGPSERLGPHLIPLGHHGRPRSCDGLVFAGNVVVDPLYCGVRLANVSDVRVEGNTFVSTNASPRLAKDSAIVCLWGGRALAPGEKGVEIRGNRVILGPRSPLARLSVSAPRKGEVVSDISAGHVAPAAATAGEAVLWPSDTTVLRAQQDSSISALPDGAMGVTTGVKASWPGVRMDFLKGEADLSRFGRFVVTVSNTTDQMRTVHLSVKGRGVQGQGPGGSVTLKPRTAGEIVAYVRRMPWALDEPLKLDGMNGRPAGQNGAGGGFDIRHATSFHIFFCQDGVASGFSVLRVTADGDGAPPPKVLPAKTFLPFVDRFGQFMHDDWPGKVHDEAELACTKADEDAWLAKNGTSPIPEADRFGGWAGGPQLKATGFFRTEKVNGKWWLVDPDGRLFFSHGVDCVGIGNGTTGIGFREKYFSWLPAKDDPAFGGFWGHVKWPAAHNFYKDPEHLPYDTFSFANANLRRKYGEGWKAEYIDRAHRRLRAWGLNTIANWSWNEIYRLDRTPYTLCLGTHGAPRLKDSKGWWGALPDPFNPEFEKTFRARARNAAKTMRDDPWCVGVFVDNELSWNGEERMKAVAEQYFCTIRRVLKEELPNHLYLGCRIAWGTDVIYRAAARHCDVVSVNIYNRRPVRDLPPDAEDKPMINGEFHFGALDRGMFHTGLVVTRDQNERAQCYRDFVNACLDHPRFVGTHWFQWQDQALTGRSDGENYQIGFLNVADIPYPELVQAARDVAATMYRRRWGCVPTEKK